MNSREAIGEAIKREAMDRLNLVSVLDSADQSVLDFAVTVFGSPQAAAVWLISPKASFNYLRPPQLLTFPDQVEQVRAALGQIEYGIL